MNNKIIGVIGLGYVGLPLAVEFGKKRKVIGFDINKKRVGELEVFTDSTLEVSSRDLRDSKYVSFTSNLQDLISCEIYIITVPTPIDVNNQPNLKPLINASKSVGSIIKKNDIVIYESTVYPGATEEVCVPLLEEYSNLRFNKDFFCGYSPERINPGDKEHNLTSIKKVTSGSTPSIANFVDNLYLEIIKAGTHKAKSIKVAEAAKVIENTQRDVNIALVNEFSLIFNKLGIDTQSVLEAASSKWNFLPFKPGLVGGHCIGVDPYYLTFKAIKEGYNPEVILAGRRINDSMGAYIANQVLNLMTNKNIQISNSRILIMGLAFKENCPDIRNSRVVDLIKELNSFNCNTDIFDPWVNKNEAQTEYDITPINKPIDKNYDAIILAVAHNEFKKISSKELKNFGKDKHVIYDIKYLLKANEADGRL
jgi:UDP-N-acetyl-D-glucosamine/UDP-N-acetyl-D-galactosamine dehydrogenase